MFLDWPLDASIASILGQIGLLFMGQGLSFATLQSGRTADPNVAITAFERTIRRLYRGAIRFASLYADRSLPCLAIRTRSRPMPAGALIRGDQTNTPGKAAPRFRARRQSVRRQLTP